MRKPLLMTACLLMWSCGSASAAECPTELKVTDTYKELSATLKCLNDRIKVLEAQRGTASKAGSASEAPAPAAGFNVTVLKGAATASAGQYQVDVAKCQRIKDILRCSLSITSRGKDGQAYIAVDESRIFDTQGRDFRAMRAEIGGNTYGGGVNDAKDLLADLPTVAGVDFPADNGIVGIAALRLQLCGDGMNTCQTVSFRNLAVN